MGLLRKSIFALIETNEYFLLLYKSNLSDVKTRCQSYREILYSIWPVKFASGGGHGTGLCARFQFWRFLFEPCLRLELIFCYKLLGKS